MNKLRVLVGCEFSGIVRDAFAALGHDAWSCDLLPTERPGQHILGDVLGVLGDGWDLAVFHPPCTHLSVSGARWWPDKLAEQAEAVAFFMALVNAPIPRIAVENPVGIMSTVYRQADQVIQPYWFGHDASKATCLWLKNLPFLWSTGFYPPRYVNGLPRWSNQTDTGQNRLTPDDDRAIERSRTYEGIAAAMAAQWTVELPIQLDMFQEAAFV